MTKREHNRLLLIAITEEAGWWANWIETGVPKDIIERAIWRLTKTSEELTHETQAQ